MTDQGEAFPQLDVSVAYDPMLNFLGAYWKRGDGASDDIAVLLSGLQRLQETECRLIQLCGTTG